MKQGLRITRLIEYFLRRRWGMIWRGALCWALGCLFLISDEGTSFDSRFQIRGDRAPSAQIVLITLRPNEMSRNRRLFPEASESFDVTDSTYWDQRMWSELLRAVLSGEPRKVG